MIWVAGSQDNLRAGGWGPRGEGPGDGLYVKFELCDHELAVMNLWIYAYVIPELSLYGWFMGLIGFSCTQRINTTRRYNFGYSSIFLFYTNGYLDL